MTPRTECEGFELTDDLEFIRHFIQTAGHSRIPVYEGDFDHVIGILHAKDLLRFLGHDVRSFKIRSVLRKPTFVPETKPLTHLLDEFQQNKVHMAIVVDEYGGTAGLVTIEDVLEEIVGEIEDEFEPATETPPSIELDEASRAVVVDARAYIDDVNDILENIGAALPENDGYDTVGGFVLATLGHMPVSGEQWRQNGYIIHVIDAEPTRVTRVRITFREHDEHRPADAESSSSTDPDAADADYEEELPAPAEDRRAES
jgi:magnesium and cobalt transporter